VKGGSEHFIGASLTACSHPPLPYDMCRTGQSAFHHSHLTFHPSHFTFHVSPFTPTLSKTGMSKPIIEISHVSKRYRISGGREPYLSLRDEIAKKLSPAWRKAHAQQEEFWALKDVSFEVQEGEAVGIIGRNGAGKTTLLKILSQITPPTEGRITMRGRVASLLEVGTGFHPELTGRENIYLNGAILGMTRREIARKFDEIVAFAEVEQFLDTPVKRYSSGMYVRLAFAVAAHLEPEILIVDEVLAVGDAEFQKKCLGKMGEVTKGGRTVLFVSHNMGAVETLCGTAVLLIRGQVVASGDRRTVIERYLANEAGAHGIEVALRPNIYGLYVTECGFTDVRTGMPTTQLRFGRAYRLTVGIGAARPFASAGVSIVIRDQLGTRVTSICPVAEGLGFLDIQDRILLDIEFDRMPLYPNSYTVDVLVHGPYDATEYLRAESVLQFDVEALCCAGATRPYERHHGCAMLHSRVNLRFVDGVHAISNPGQSRA